MGTKSSISGPIGVICMVTSNLQTDQSTFEGLVLLKTPIQSMTSWQYGSPHLPPEEVFAHRNHPEETCIKGLDQGWHWTFNCST